MQLASHNGLLTFHLVRAVFFFLYLRYLPAKLYFPANNHLGRKYPFPFVEEKVLFIAKNLFQTKRRSQRIFPIDVFSFCLSHTFITHVVIDIFILYYSFLFYYICNFYGHELVVLRQWGLHFHNIYLRAKRNLRIAVQTFIHEQMAVFFMHRISASF